MEMTDTAECARGSSGGTMGCGIHGGVRRTFAETRRRAALLGRRRGSRCGEASYLERTGGRRRRRRQVRRRRHPPGRARCSGTQPVVRAPARRAAHGRPSHGGSARRRSLRLRCGGMGRLDRGRARATGGLEQRLAWPRLGGAPAPVGPKLRPSRSAHRPASARQVAAQRGVVDEGAVLRVVVGHESAPMARRARPAHRVCSRSPSWVPRRARDDSGRRTSKALTGGSAHPSLP